MRIVQPLCASIVSGILARKDLIICEEEILYEQLGDCIRIFSMRLSWILTVSRASCCHAKDAMVIKTTIHEGYNHSFEC